MYSSPFSNLKSWCSVGSKSYIATTVSSSSLPFSSTGGTGGGGLRWKRPNVIIVPLHHSIPPHQCKPVEHPGGRSWAGSGCPGASHGGQERQWQYCSLLLSDHLSHRQQTQLTGAAKFQWDFFPPWDRAWCPPTRTETDLCHRVWNEPPEIQTPSQNPAIIYSVFSRHYLPRFFLASERVISLHLETEHRKGLVSIHLAITLKTE